MTTEALLALADSRGHTVDYYPLHANKAFTVEDDQGCHIILSGRLRGIAEKEELSHEIGHCEFGGTYNRYSPYDLQSRSERRAKKWQYNKLIPVGEVRELLRHGVTSVWELAEHFDVSGKFCYDALQYYRAINLM